MKMLMGVSRMSLNDYQIKLDDYKMILKALENAKIYGLENAINYKKMEIEALENIINKIIIKKRKG